MHRAHETKIADGAFKIEKIETRVQTANLGHRLDVGRGVLQRVDISFDPRGDFVPGHL
jgi:hypothetical protein